MLRQRPQYLDLVAQAFARRVAALVQLEGLERIRLAVRPADALVHQRRLPLAQPPLDGIDVVDTRRHHHAAQVEHRRRLLRAPLEQLAEPAQHTLKKTLGRKTSRRTTLRLPWMSSAAGAVAICT